MKLDAEALGAIDAGVGAVAHRLRPEDRWDLRQALAEKLLRLKKRPDDVRSWVHVAACNWTANFLRDEKRRRAIDSEASAGLRRSGERRSECWEPKWYPPVTASRTPLNAENGAWSSPKPGEHDWLRVAGARVMHVKASHGTVNNVENAVIACIDSRIRRAKRRKARSCGV